MNGDLSLSQTLGGLRIANPDESGSATPSPQTLPSGSIHPPPSQPFPQPQHLMPHTQSHEGGSSRSQSYSDSGSTELNSVGFDPSTYAPIAPPFVQTAPSPRGSSQQLHQRYSASQDAPYSQYYQQRQPVYQYNNARPTSGMYNPNSLSSSVRSGESAYSRVRSESTQSTQSNPQVRRNGSRAGLSNSINSVANPAANGSPFRQHSHSNPAPQGQFPPRRSSKNRGHPDENNYSNTSSSHPGSYSASTEGPLQAAEEYQDRTPRRPTDVNGRPTSKVPKKGVKDFAFGRTLGEGSYSTVMAATDRTTSKEYAIKILDKRHIIKEKKVKYVNIEKDTLNRLTEHPGVVRLYYTFQDERSLYFVLDLATGGELLGVLKKMTTFDEECSRFYGAQILDAIEYMHSRGIIHRDLKPENVLLDDQMHVKVTDFGTAKILDLSGKAQFGKVSVTNDPLDGADTDRAGSFVGTAEYVSPELLNDKNACKASDLWAFGCIVYQLLAGRPPFKASNEYQTFQKIVKLEYTFPEGFPTQAKDLVTKLLVLDPAQRLPIDQIKSHPFFAGITWGKGLWKQKAPTLRAYNPTSRADAKPRDDREGHSSHPVQISSKQATPIPQASTTSSRPTQARIITQLAPPSQLDIDWSPVLTRSNERIVKLGQLVVYSSPAPHSPTSRSNGPGDQSAEQPSKLSRLFGASVTKKRQRLVMITSSARLVIAPSGGERKEAKQIVNLTDDDVICRSQQDAKGYQVWCVYTRDRHLTFEDPKANTGDPGSSMRSTQEWLDLIDDVKDYVPARSPYPNDAFGAMTSSVTTPGTDSGDAMRLEGAHVPQFRKTLRKDPSEEDTSKSRKRFSRRHSKNGLAAVF